MTRRPDETEAQYYDRAYRELGAQGGMAGLNHTVEQFNLQMQNDLRNTFPPVTIPLGAQPVQYYFRGDRYPVHFDRIVMPTFTTNTVPLMPINDTVPPELNEYVNTAAYMGIDNTPQMPLRWWQRVGRTWGKSTSALARHLLHFYHILGGFPTPTKPETPAEPTVFPSYGGLSVDEVMRLKVNRSSRSCNSIDSKFVWDVFGPVPDRPQLEALLMGDIVQSPSYNYSLPDAEQRRNGRPVRVWSSRECTYV